MNIQEYDILNAIFTTTNATQRSLADCSGHSLGIVNRSIKKLTSDGYLTTTMQPTDRAIALSILFRRMPLYSLRVLE